MVSSNPLNNNDNVPQLQVPQIASKLPFSSPVSDDQISNRSFESRRTPTLSDLASSPYDSQNPFDDSESGNTSGQDEFHLERYSESSTWRKNGPGKHRPGETSRDLQQGREVSPGRRRNKPGLNVVTDFSRTTKQTPVENANPTTIHKVPVQRPKVGEDTNASISRSQTSIRRVGLQGRIANAGFVNLNDLEKLRKNESIARPKARKGAKKCRTNPYEANQDLQRKDHNAVDDVLASGPSRGGLSLEELVKSSERDRDNIQHHPQAPKHGTNETLTARSVVIGISVAQTEVEAHKPSEEASSALTLQTPITPSIIVTPADATMGWSDSAVQSSLRRPVSSVYSQMNGLVYRQDADAPPIPSLPSCHKQVQVLKPEEPRHSVDTWETSPQESRRPFSSETIIDEDDKQTETTPLSAGSKDEILSSKCDTGRPRSKGWWNLMLSPMLSRAGTTATQKAAYPSEEAPALPRLSMTTRKGLDLGDQSMTDDISPQTPRRAGLDTIRDSSYSNWTHFGHNREQGYVSQQSPGCMDGEVSNTTLDDESDLCRQVAADVSAKEFGLAAEYYQACAFDLLNPLPYFDCVNHDCANALPKLGGAPKSVMLPTVTNGGLNSGTGVPMIECAIKPSTPPMECRLRSESDSTIIEDDPIELSPNVRKADARQILKAVQPNKIDASPKKDPGEIDKPKTLAIAAEEAGAPASRSATPPPYSPPPAKPNIPRYVGIMPPSRQFAPSSPGPLSPEATRAMSPGDGIPMSQVHQPAPTFINFNSTYPADLHSQHGAACVSLSDVENPVEVRQKAEARRRRLEQEDTLAHKAGGFWRGRGCFPRRGCYGRGGSAARNRRRWYIVISTGFVMMIILVVVLATQLTRRGDQTPVQSQWVNLTGYPPMPTGISTIAQPDITSAVTACVHPSSLWSCALPREDQARNSPANFDQPSFRLEIRFRNGTVSANETIPISSVKKQSVTASRRMAPIKRQNDPFTNSLFEPNPAPPDLAEQQFIGNTTDNTTFPFNGEATPFFITFLNSDPSIPKTFDITNKSSRQRLRRQTGASLDSVPAPAVLSNGTVAPANLLPNNPLPSSQPVMLYNRGLDTEHYGFYTYFDKSIFVQSTAEFNSSFSSTDSQVDDRGGSSKQDADLRCTWAQTRFLVQIWTSAEFSGQLLPSANGTGTSSGPADNLGGNSTSKESSATDYRRPGSFPYPVTVTLDRHGGESSKKGVYCYGMDEQQKIVISEKKLVAELRGAGGTLINPAPGIFSSAATNTGFDPNAGGIDGGTGGCACEWRNWEGKGGG